MIKKKTTIMLLLVAFIVTGATALQSSYKPRYENLQVLPQNISETALDSIMKSYNTALGVTCAFCHDPVQGFKDSLNYVTDNNPMKEEGRKMIRLTMDINTNYFYYDTTKHPAYLNVVTCYTCHRGDAFPE